MFKPIHKHLLVFAKINKFPNADEEKVVIKFMEKLVDKVDMKIIGGPIASYVSDTGNIGWTSTLLLSTSHAAMHIWNEWGNIQLDLYSCKEFDEKVVLSHIKETFDATMIKFRILNRDGGLNDEEGLKIHNYK
jgi:S-adenosylmethionine decarboxylase|tara:strand:+ start:102 stop:500 length:399 start_codon:yes stop_codon:yes gene_type:complete